MASAGACEVLGEELEELGLSASALARALDVPTNRVTATSFSGESGRRFACPVFRHQLAQPPTFELRVPSDGVGTRDR